MSISESIANHTKKSSDAGSEHIRVTAEAVQAARQFGREAASESVRRFTDQVAQAFGMMGEGREDLTRQTSQNLEVVTDVAALLTRGGQDISREWFGLIQERLQKNLDDFSALARCRSVPDFMAVQSSLMRGNLERTIEATRRIAEVATRAANEANQALTAQTKKARHSA